MSPPYRYCSSLRGAGTPGRNRLHFPPTPLSTPQLRLFPESMMTVLILTETTAATYGAIKAAMEKRKQREENTWDEIDRLRRVEAEIYRLKTILESQGTTQGK